MTAAPEIILKAARRMFTAQLQGWGTGGGDGIWPTLSSPTQATWVELARIAWETYEEHVPEMKGRAT